MSSLLVVVDAVLTDFVIIPITKMIRKNIFLMFKYTKQMIHISQLMTTDFRLHYNRV